MFDEIEGELGLAAQCLFDGAVCFPSPGDEVARWVAWCLYASLVGHQLGRLARWIMSRDVSR